MFCSSLKSHILSLTSYLTSQTSWCWRLFRQFTLNNANDRIPALLFRLKVNIVCFKGPTQVTFVINDLDVHIYWKSPGKAYRGIDDKKVKSRWRLINFLWTVQQQKQTCYTRIWPETSKWDCWFFFCGRLHSLFLFQPSHHCAWSRKMTQSFKEVSSYLNILSRQFALLF